MSKTLPAALTTAVHSFKTIRTCSGDGLEIAYYTESMLPVLPHVQEAIDHAILRDFVCEAGPLHKANRIVAIVPDDPRPGPYPDLICKIDLLVSFKDMLGPDRPPVRREINVPNWPLF